jgi:oxygen-independent coproporphyrinogen-3 oxidase
LKKKSELVKSLITEIKLRKNELANQPIETIYLGGGTPSLLTAHELQRLIETIFKNFKVVEEPEITIEANPDDLTKKHIKELENSPVNRLSIGIQSFFDNDLSQMNRAHNAIEAKTCLANVRDYFNNISIDLIYGIPEMSVDKWLENLQIAFGFNVPHISSYALTIEPKTALATFIKRGTFPPIDEHLALQHFHALIKETRKHEFVHYEISNFGKEGYFSKHNTSYWLGESYLGIGPSAHSYNGNQRSWNISNNSKYIESIQNNQLPSSVEKLSTNDKFNENIMTGLRTIWGISLDKIEKNFEEETMIQLLKSAQKFIDQDLLKLDDKTLKVTEKGKFLVDGIASELFMI